MTTKEQERKALAQIKKIVESLGEDSYIGMALEGCLTASSKNSGTSSRRAKRTTRRPTPRRTKSRKRKTPYFLPGTLTYRHDGEK